jgi:hypothetical protein
MKDEMRKQSIDYASIDRNDPATVEDADKIEIDVKGVPLTKTTAFRNLIAERFSASGRSRRELHRLPSEYAALRAGHAEARHGGAFHCRPSATASTSLG